MRVMQVMAGASQGGAENIFLESVLALDDASVEQYVVTRPNNTFRIGSFKERGIPVATTSFGKIFKAPTRATLSAANAEFKPDIIQYWMGRAGTFAIESQAVNVGWYGGYYKLERFKRCQHHVALTGDIAKHIVAQGASPERVQIIHTYAEFYNAAPTPRASLDTPEEAPLLLSLARLHTKKALDILLEAMVLIPGAYLWIAGEGPIEKELRKLCTSLGLDDRVRFLGWRDDRGSLLRAADICVFPSRYEPFGTVTVDAWSSSTPLVAAKAAGPKAYVTHEKDGLLVEIDDVKGFANAVNRIVNDPSLRERLVAGGNSTYNERFTKDVFVRDSLAFYERIVSQ